MEDKYPLDTIYQYTESLLKAQEESRQRVNLRTGAFIGYIGVLLRLTLDLPNTNKIITLPLKHEFIISGFHLKIAISILCCAALVISVLALTIRFIGQEVIHPSALMSDEWFYNYTEDEHKSCIINSWISAMDKYEKIDKKRQIRFNITAALFTVAVILFAIGVLLPQNS